MNINTKDERQKVRKMLDQLAKEKITADFDVVMDDLQNFDPSSPKEDTTVRGILDQAHRHLDQLDRLDRPYPVLEDAPSREEVDDYEPEFLIDNWMPANRLTILTGPGGTGKSYLALQHICGLAMGISDHQLIPYHGAEEEMYEKNQEAFRKDPINVVIASYEEDLMETWSRISKICDWLGWADYDCLKERIKFVDLKMFGPLWGVNEDTHMTIRSKLLDVGDWLLNECQEFGDGARLLMLDPSAGAYGGSEIAREAVREFCSHLNGWGQQVECATLLIAHPPKTGDDPYSGSTDWLGSCRAMWTLRAEERKQGIGQKAETFKWYQLTNVKQNYTAPQRSVYLQKIKDDTNKEWTPIWKKCSESEAEAFYKEYHNDNSLSVSEPQEDSNENRNIPQF